MKEMRLIFEALRDLISLILPPRMFARFFFSPVFVFLVHPRDEEDVFNKYPFLRILTPSQLRFFLRFLWPVALSRVTGIFSVGEAKPLPGAVFTISLISDQILKDKDLARRKIVQAVKLAEKYGAKVIGLGGYTSSVVGSAGELGIGHDIIVTTGNTLTAIVSLDSIKEILLRSNKKVGRIKIAVLGATGSVGRILTKLLILAGAKDIILIGKTPERLKVFMETLHSQYPGVAVYYTVDLKSLAMSDLIVTSTNAPASLIEPEHLKKNAIVYDVSQPKNVSGATISARPDCFFYEGGLVRSPEQILYNFNFRLPPGVIFACLAETIIIAAADFEKEEVLEGQPDYINLLKATMTSVGFVPYCYKMTPEE
jgi:predicted amino acid dehydrogenase